MGIKGEKFKVVGRGREDLNRPRERVTVEGSNF